jgi:hypothetical protein
MQRYNIYDMLSVFVDKWMSCFVKLGGMVSLGWMPCFVESRNRILGDYWVFVVYGNVFKFSDDR